MAIFSSSKNNLALGILIFGKALGVGGLVLGAVNRVAGGTLLVLDAACIVVAIAMCIRTAREQNQAANDDKAVLARMVREGTLKQYLRDLEENERKQAATTGDAVPAAD